jgi:hypothetical protein
MANGVEAAVGKRQHCGVADNDPTGPWNAVFASSFSGDPKAREWEVYEHGVTTGGFGHIESGPAGTCANVQETQARSQLQKFSNLIRFGPGRPAAAAIVATADPALD